MGRAAIENDNPGSRVIVARDYGIIAKRMDGLARGHAFSHYELAEKLGEGGMGEVWKARDTRLNRFAAVKFLRTVQGAPDDARKRFLQEAQSASSLNHPNIITIYELGEEAGADFIAMEYVAGKTLDHLIPRKGLPLAPTLAYAIPLADALARAHAAGIIHRDLKPSNIMVGDDGSLKLLDFGLAKLAFLPHAAAEDATRTLKAETEKGTIVGTISYMSPEQAEGKEIDSRSDIFSFGAVLYEMLTGRRAFQGETRVSTLANILNRDPRPVREISADLPPEAERLVNRCLRKNPARRFQTMADLKVTLEDLREESGTARVSAPVAKRGQWRLALAAAALGILAGALGVGLWLRPGAPASLLSLTRITADSGLSWSPAVSADGKLIAFSSDRSGEGNLDIWVRQAAGGEPIRVTRNQANNAEPAFSPDSSRIAFRSERDGGGIYVVSALGGEERLLVRHGHTPQFSPDGKWISYRAGEEGGSTGLRDIFIVPAGGGKPIPIPSQLGGLLAGIWSPDSRSLLLAGSDAKARAWNWCVVEVEGGATECLNPGSILQRQEIALPYPSAWTGNYLYFAASSGAAQNLWRIRLSGKRKLAAAAERLTTGTGQESQPSVAFGANGVDQVAFTSGGDNVDIWSIRLAADGRAGSEPRRMTTGPEREDWPSLTPDGRWMAYGTGSGRLRSIRVRDLASGKETQAVDGVDFPALSPGGNRLAVVPRKPEVLAFSLPDLVPEKIAETRMRPEAWSRDGRWLVLMSFGNPSQIFLCDVHAKRTTPLLTHPSWPLHAARFSPDERWISFHASTSAATRRIFLAPFQDGKAGAQDSWVAVTDGKALDREARWAPDGKSIYFLSDRDGYRCIWAQPVDLARRAVTGNPFPVFHAHSARLTLTLGTDTGSNGLSIVPGKIVVAMAENTGNVWLGTFR